MKRLIFLTPLLILLMFSCRKGRQMKTDDGFKYILYTESGGKKIKQGDYVTLVMVYRNSKDSIMYDSRTGGGSIRFKLDKIPFKGSYEDGLTYLSENDSATFFVPADSLYNYLYQSHGVADKSMEEAGFVAGSMLKFDIKVLRVQSPAEAEEEMMLALSEKEKNERVQLFRYIGINKISETPDSSGYYLIVRERGNGKAVDSGMVVSVRYEARFLNDTVFDGTKHGPPFRFISGSGNVIKAWELAMKKLRMGDKVTLITPSLLAYGEEGVRDPKSGIYIVPPFCPLVFDITVESVEAMPAVSNKQIQ